MARAGGSCLEGEDDNEGDDEGYYKQHNHQDTHLLSGAPLKHTHTHTYIQVHMSVSETFYTDVGPAPRRQWPEAG